MNDFQYAPARYYGGSNQKVNDVCEIFYEHWQRMDNERRAAMNDIEKWRHEWTDTINKHAYAQISLLKDDYNLQRLAFDAKRNDTIDTIIACSNPPQYELISQLLNECRTLQFQVAKLQFKKRDVEFPTVFTVEELKKQKGADARAGEQAIFRDNAASKYNNDGDNRRGASANNKTTE
jgi:hypothetical protein